MAERVGPSSNTLVKYDNPTLVTKHDDAKRPGTTPQTRLMAQMAQNQGGQEESGGLKAPPDQKRETEDILNQILPPREWEEENQIWRQCVSSQPATRLDVVNLQEQLDMRLQQRQARETGICPVRRELYSQCLDEIIRQVTINCSERGLMLLRLRDEIVMTIAAYQTLYESSIAFGMRKSLMAEQGKAELEDEILQLREQKVHLEKQVIDLRARAEQIERRANETRLAEEKKHAEEVQFLKKTNAQLKSQIEGIITPKK